ncbi:hypothetical protein L208DRAFT_1401969, partial [Tricholoma matsutake]
MKNTPNDCVTHTTQASDKMDETVETPWQNPRNPKTDEKPQSGALNTTQRDKSQQEERRGRWEVNERTDEPTCKAAKTATSPMSTRTPDRMSPMGLARV